MKNNKIRKLLSQNTSFLLPFFAIWLAGALLLLLYCKGAIHLWINHHSTPFLDDFFRFVTLFGDGLVILILALGFIVFHLRKSVVILLSWAFSGLLVQVLKIFVFDHILRPVKYFEGSASLHLVEGVKIYLWQSFPSGHSASAFALFFCLAAFTGNRALKMLFLLIATLTSFSRMYLSQHFLPDVLAGSMIGLFFAILFLCLLYESRPYPVLDHSIFSFFNK